MIDDFYRIKNTETGLFSPGGAYANKPWSKWQKVGKLWPTKRSINLHLSQYVNKSQSVMHVGGIPENWVVVKQFNGVEEEFSARDFYLRKIIA